MIQGEWWVSWGHGNGSEWLAEWGSLIQTDHWSLGDEGRHMKGYYESEQRNSSTKYSPSRPLA